MKAIMVNNDTIISLENVKEIHLREEGSGSKNNPRCAWIDIEYLNEELTSTPCLEDVDIVKDWFYKMYEILIKD